MKYTHVTSAMVAAVLTIALVFAPTSASAGTATANIAVSATVSNYCSISATALAFGAYSYGATTADTGTSTITVNCTNNAPYTVSLDKGTGTGATITTRQMMNGGPSGTALAYSLYSDGGHTSIWGDGTSSTSTSPGTGSGQNQTLTVYGQIPTGQSVAAGNYTDTITATISY